MKVSHAFLTVSHAAPSCQVMPLEQSFSGAAAAKKKDPVDIGSIDLVGLERATGN